MRPIRKWTAFVLAWFGWALQQPGTLIVRLAHAIHPEWH